MKVETTHITHDICDSLQKLKLVTNTNRISKHVEHIIDKIQEWNNHFADAFYYPYDTLQKMHFSKNSDFLDLVNNFEKF